MKIGIIGSGNIGSTLAHYLVKLGNEVVISNSRGIASLQEIIARTGALAGTVEDAASANDLVIIAVPEKAIPQLPLKVLSASKAVIIHAGNYYPSRDGKNADIENGLTDSEWVAKVISHPVIKAFNNILANSLASKALPAGDENRITLSVAGNEVNEKKMVMQLIEVIGFDAIDAGSLSNSWRQQPGEPAYCQDLDKENLIAALAKADFTQRSVNLANADEQARPYF